MAEQTHRKAPGKQPISRHPLFPATVALWFAAVFALASLAFTPPLGVAVRIVVVLAVAAIGGFLGLAIARRLASPKPAATAPEDQSADDGDGGNALWSELKSERRALVASEDGPAIERVEAAHPTEHEPRILDVASVGIDGFDDGLPAPAESDLRASPETSEPALSGGPRAEPAPPVEPAALSAAERIAGADLDELSHVELLERLAVSMQRRNRPTDPVAQAPNEPSPTRATVTDTEPSGRASDEADSALLSLGRPTAVRSPVHVEQADELPIAFPGHAERRSVQRGAACVAPALRETRAQRAREAPEFADRQEPEEAEKALRDALAALQRMSGGR